MDFWVVFQFFTLANHAATNSLLCQLIPRATDPLDQPSADVFQKWPDEKYSVRAYELDGLSRGRSALASCRDSGLAPGDVNGRACAPALPLDKTRRSAGRIWTVVPGVGIPAQDDSA